MTIYGTITDAATGESLAAASLQIQGTYQGTIANGEGRYELRLTARPAVLVVRYIGYATQAYTVAVGSGAEHHIALQPVTLEMEGVLVTGEDPAINIMRKVIERKQEWRATLATYEAEAYTRMTISNDSGIVSIIESLTQSYWDHERGAREVLKSNRKTSNMGIDDMLPAAALVANLYDDNIDIGGYNMIGVTHPDALRHYHFELEGYRNLDDQVVYDITVRPKNRLKSAFVGRVSVLDEVYALLEVELRPGEAFIFPPPIDHFYVTYQQQFSNYGGEYWLPVDFRADMRAKIKMGALLAFPEFKLKQSSRLSNYQINGPLPDSLYEERRLLTVDSTAVEADTLLDRGGNAVPLTELEARAYEEIDSTLTMERAFKPTGMMARFVEEDGGGGGSGGGGRDVFSFTPDVRYNRVEGGRLALKADVRLGKYATLTGRGGYLTGRDEATYGGGLQLNSGWKIPQVRLFFEGDYRYGVDLRYPSAIHSDLLRSPAVLLGGHDYFDYLGTERVRARAGFFWWRHEVKVQVGLNVERHFSVDKTTDYDLLGESAWRPNPEIQEGQMRSLAFSFAVNDEDEVPVGLFGQRRLIVNVEHSPAGFLGNAFDFTKVDAVVEWRFPTFFKRRLLPNALDVRLVGGTARGALPLQRFGIIDASTVHTPFGALRTLDKIPYEGDRYAGVFWEHSFRTIPFELLGWRGIVKRGWNVLLTGGHARTWLSDGNRPRPGGYVPHVPRQFHHEIGVSLSGLFGTVRVDFSKRLDAGGYAIGFSMARFF